jgi:CubicO group peptidase (beta-lactamase class C family)
VLAVLWVALAPAAIAGEASRVVDPQLLAGFEACIREQMESDHTTGLAMGFMLGDSIWARGYGYADVENRVPVTPRSSFRLASVTKPMTAVAVLQLAEQGRIDLDAEIQTYVPYFPRKAHPVTVRQLLGHLGGITHYKNRDVELHIKEHKTTREAIAIFADYDLVAEPGIRYSYSTYGYNLLGAAIEGATGQSYGDYMRDHVWGPLGMNDTRMDDPRALIPNRVRGYQRVDGELRHSEFVDVSSRFAGGGTRGTVVDLLKFARGFMDGKLIGPESMERMTTPMTTSDGNWTSYGMGWDVWKMEGHYVVSHSGGQNETRTLLFVLPVEKCALALACNFESGEIFPYMQAMARAVLEERWDRQGGSSAYVGDPVQAAQLEALGDAFNHGMWWFEKKHRAWTDSEADLNAAFTYLASCTNRKTLGSDPEAATTKREEGLQPPAGAPLVAVGSFVASKLEERFGPDRLETYHRMGAVAFFADYVESCKQAKVPRSLRLPADLEKQVERWNRDWQRTADRDIRTLCIGPGSDLGALGKQLREKFAGASIYPDLGGDFSALIRTGCVDGQRDRTVGACDLVQELYPQSGGACLAAGSGRMFFGDDKGRDLLRRAARLAPTVASAERLNDIAYECRGLGRMDAGVQVLGVAIELYPKEANLHDSLGEFQLAKGDTVQAITSYERALAVNPEFVHASEMLQKIRPTEP